MELIGVKEVMKLYKVGRTTATRLLSDKTCPTLPRVKNAPYKVEKEAFEEWLKRSWMR